MVTLMADDGHDLRTGRHVVYRLHVHVVLVTKYRRGAITDRVRELLETTTREVCARHGTTVSAFDGEDDHIHLLLDYPPKISVTTLVLAIKTNTSRVVREQEWHEVTRALWGEHFWSPSYCAVSTGGAALDVVRRYVENQRLPARKPGRPKRNALTPALTDGVSRAQNR